MSTRTLLITGYLLLLTACKGDIAQPPGDDLEVSIGTSFGMCAGYCIEEYVLTKDVTQGIRKPHQLDSQHPEITVRIATPPDLWERMVKNVDMQKFVTIPATNGCPDCADGGAEWLRIRKGAAVHTVTYEFGTYPPGAAMVTKIARAIREKAQEQMNQQ
jgi:hypothetical protein